MTMLFPSTGAGTGQILPFQGAVNAQQMSTFLDLEQADIIRMKRYAERWRFYHSQHWQFDRDEGAPLVTVNYAKLIADKAVSWMTKNGVDVDYPEATKAVVQPYLEEVWNYNRRSIFLTDLCLTGAVTGDMFVLVTYAEPTTLARRRNPHSRGQVKIDLLGSEQCFPTWDPLDASVLTSIRIETIFYDHNTRLRAFEDDSHPRQGQGTITIRRFTQIITPDTIVEQYEGGIPKVIPNALGEIPVVHIKNLPVPRDFYGLADLDPILNLQQELNEKATDNSDIIHYHAGPTTVITGAKSGQVEKSPNKIWSGLPSDAKVQNLEMTTDLGAVAEYIQSVRKWILEISETPEVLVEQPPISNTSAAAIHMMYQAIIDKTERKLPLFEAGLEMINYFVLRIAQSLGHILLPFDLCFAAGTPVRVREGWIAIEDVSVGEEVLTHKNRWQSVTAAFSTPRGDRKVFQVRAVGDVDPLVVTEEHPFYVARREQWQRKPGEPVRWSNVRGGVEREWVPVQDIRVGDYVCYPIDQESFEYDEFDVHAMRVLGYYAADGHVVKQRSGGGKRGKRIDLVAVSWTFNIEHEFKVDSLRESLQQLGFRDPRVYKHPDKGACQVVCYGKDVVALCKDHCGMGSASKVLSGELMTAELDLQLVFVGAYLDCDGSQDSNTGAIRYASASKVMAEQIRVLLLRQEIWCTLHKERGLYFYGSIGLGYADKIEAVSRLFVGAEEAPRGPAQFVDGVLYRRVTSVEDVSDENDDAEFYNLSVEEDESYVVGITTVHNCQHCKGRIVEVYDTRTKRFMQRCYAINDDFTWKDPEDEAVMHIRQHSMGYEVRESPMSQVREEHMQVGSSYWDPQDPVSLQEYQDRRTREADRVETAARQQAPQPPPKPTPQGQAPAPKAPPPPAVKTPQTTAEPPRLQGEMSYPKEPEWVALSTINVDPTSGATSGVQRERKLLIPTDCSRPMFLDPYAVPMTFKSSLPRDEALELQQHIQMHDAGIVSAAWIRRKRSDIDQDEYDVIEEELRAEERDRARPEGVVPEDKEDAGIREQALGKAKPGVGPESSDITKAMKAAGPNAPKEAVA